MAIIRWTTKKEKRLQMYEIFFILATVLITPLRIFTFITTLTTVFRLTLTFAALGFFCLGVFCAPKKMRNHLLLMLIATFVFCSIDYYGQWKDMISYAQKMYAYYLFFLPFLLALFFASYENEKVKKGLIRYILLMEGITLVTTLIGLHYFPAASRELASTVNDLPIYYEMNIGGYDFIYGMAIAFPLMLHSAVNGKKKPITICVLIAIAYCILLSQYSTALFIIVAVTVLYFVRRIKDHTIRLTTYILSFILLFLVLLLMDYILTAIGNLFTTLDLTTMAQKFYDTVESNNNSAAVGTVGDRLNYYMLSANTFIEHPLFGKLFDSSLKLGGHSEFLDILAAGGIPLLLLVIYLLRTFRKAIQKECKASHATSYHGMFMLIYLGFIVMTILNPVLNSPMIAINAFLLPALCLNTYHSNEKGKL